MLSPWIPALSASGLLAIGLWLARKLIATRLAASVEHEFDIKLEALRSQLRDSEARFAAELRKREIEIDALRNGALTAMTSRQVALEKRRLDAVDQLWETFTSLQSARYIATLLTSIKFEVAAAQAVHSEKTREAFKLMGSGFDPKRINYTGAAKARPFVTPMVWAVFSAFQAVVAHSMARWMVLTTGVGDVKLIDDGGVKKLILAVFPSYGDYLDKNGATAFFYVLEPLESRLLEEIRLMLRGDVDDQTNVEQAARIVALANSVTAADRKASAPVA